MCSFLILLFRAHHLYNSTTELVLIPIYCACFYSIQQTFVRIESHVYQMKVKYQKNYASLALVNMYEDNLVHVLIGPKHDWLRGKLDRSCRSSTQSWWWKWIERLFQCQKSQTQRNIKNTSSHLFFLPIVNLQNL